MLVISLPQHYLKTFVTSPWNAILQWDEPLRRQLPVEPPGSSQQHEQGAELTVAWYRYRICMAIFIQRGHCRSLPIRSNRGRERRWSQNKTGVVYRYPGSVSSDCGWAAVDSSKKRISHQLVTAGAAVPVVSQGMLCGKDLLKFL